MKWRETPLRGCLIIENQVQRDARGTFTKVYKKSLFEEKNTSFSHEEEYYSLSKQNVIRGMHFQTPPFAYRKLVYCSMGAILDVLLDLRQGSPSYGRAFSIELSSDNGRSVYLPEGIAHGFCVTTTEAIVNYRVSTPYSPPYDCGVRWDSFGFDWICQKPIVSDRDRKFPLLTDFESPFKF